MTPEEAEAARNANREIKFLGDQPKETPELYKQDAVENAIDIGVQGGKNYVGAAIAKEPLQFLAKKAGANLLGRGAAAAAAGTGFLPVMGATGAYYAGNALGKAIDNKYGVSDKIADFITNPSGKEEQQQDGDLRRDLMKRGLDINKPIMKNPMARPGMQDYGVVSGYGEMDITPGKENMYNLGPQHSMYDPNRAPAPVAAPVAAPVTPGQPNLSAVPGAPTDAAAPVAQPNLAAVQPAAPQGPQGPQKGDLIGSYLGKDGSNIGMFEGMPNAPITAEQLAGLENRMDAGGMPVVSGTNAPGLVRAMDSMGNIQFANPEQANAMNATMGETIRAEKAAQQRAINSDYMRERGNAAIRNMQANAPINYYDQASRQAQESIANRPDFSQAFSGVGSAGVSSGGASRDGGDRGGSSEDKPSDFGDARPSQNVPSDVRTALSIPAGDRTAKQNKRVAAWEGSTQGKEMGGAAGYAESQMTPQERADMQLERNKVQAQIDSYKSENPDKYQQAKGIIDAVLQGDMYKNLSPAQKSEVKSLMMLQYMGVDVGETDFGPEINAILDSKPEDPSADSSTDPTDPNA